MSIIKAYTLPHPPLVIPAVGRGKEKDIQDTLTAFERVGEDIAKLQPETIIFITPHGTVYSDYFHISPGQSAEGDFGRFAAPDVRINTNYDEELIDVIEQAAMLSDIPAGTEGEKDSRLDHGVMVPMWYINKHYTDYKSVRVSQSGMSSCEHYLLGQILTKAAAHINRKVVVVASSDLSHRLQDGGPYPYAPEGRVFDEAVISALKRGDFLGLLKIPENIKEKAGECGYNSLMVLSGLFDMLKVDAKLLSYEGPFGVGYAIAEFLPKNEDFSRNFLEQYLEFTLEESSKCRNLEDDYQLLARQSLEHVIKTGDKLPIPKGLPSEMLSQRAGVFVSLHKNGRLRGCIGTIAPATDCIANEVISNAISAGLSDNRFDPVQKDELLYLTYKVDVLSAPESISGPGELDIKRYGVIVTSGMRRGLLLPNLDGVDTVSDQIDIACSKAGIQKGAEIKLQRFEVIRHG